MKSVRVNGLVRVSKMVAERMYGSGDKIYMCPCKMRPGPPWHPEAAIEKKEGSEDFEKLVAEFTYYNCSSCAGDYPAFYIRERDAS